MLCAHMHTACMHHAAYGGWFEGALRNSNAPGFWCGGGTPLAPALQLVARGPAGGDGVVEAAGEVPWGRDGLRRGGRRAGRRVGDGGAGAPPARPPGRNFGDFRPGDCFKTGEGPRPPRGNPLLPRGPTSEGEFSKRNAGTSRRDSPKIRGNPTSVGVFTPLSPHGGGGGQTHPPHPFTFEGKKNRSIIFIGNIEKGQQLSLRRQRSQCLGHFQICGPEPRRGTSAGTDRFPSGEQQFRQTNVQSLGGGGHDCQTFFVQHKVWVSAWCSRGARASEWLKIDMN